MPPQELPQRLPKNPSQLLQQKPRKNTEEIGFIADYLSTKAESQTTRWEEVARHNKNGTVGRTETKMRSRRLSGLPKKLNWCISPN